jgi:hypothetical protein
MKATGRTAKGKAIKVQIEQSKGRLGMTNGVIKEMTFSETISLHRVKTLGQMMKNDLYKRCAEILFDI